MTSRACQDCAEVSFLYRLVQRAGTYIVDRFPNGQSLPRVSRSLQLLHDVQLEQLPEGVDPLRQDLADGGFDGGRMLVLDSEEGHDALPEDEDCPSASGGRVGL